MDSTEACRDRWHPLVEGVSSCEWHSCADWPRIRLSPRSDSRSDVSAEAVTTPGNLTNSELNSRSFRWWGIVAGVLSIVGIVSLFTDPSSSSAQSQLSSFRANQYGYAFSDLFWVVFAVGATPFVAYLASVLRSQGRGLVWAAMLLVLFGVFALAAQSATYYGALWSISTTPAPDVATQTYEAALWYNLTTAWQMLAFLSIGAGLFLFGGAAWNSRILPNWLGAVALVGGAGGILGPILLVSVGPTVAFIPIALTPVAFLIWAFVAPAVHRRGVADAPSPAPPASSA